MKRLVFYILMFSFTIVSYPNTLNNQLWQAILDGNESLSVKLLQQGADIDALDKQGLALMHRYASSGNEFMINWLYEHGADINVRDIEASTPIFYALLNGHYRRVYQLITLGAEVNVENINGMTPRSIAKNFGSKLFLMLLDNPKSYTTQPITIELFLERQQALQENNWNKAILLSKQEFKQAPKEWDKTSPYYTRGITDLGVIYTKLGRFLEAEKCFMKSLKHWKTILPQSEQYYYSLTALAFLYRETYRYDEAIILYNECANKEEIITNPQLLWQIYSNRAAIYTQLADYEKADNDYQKAMPLVEKLPDMLQAQAWCSTVGNYALMHYYKNTPESIKKFAELLKKVIGVMEDSKLYDQNYLRFLQQLCVYEEEFGDILLAEENVNRLLVATRSILGEEHDDYLIALNLAAEISLKKDDYSQAYDFLIEALNLIKKHHTTKQTKIEWSIVSNWANLVDLILEDASTQWAHEYAYHKTLEIYGEESMYFLQQLNNLGVFWSEINQHEHALPFQRDAYFKSKKLYGDNNINTLTKSSNLWNTYAAIPTKRDSAYLYLKDNNIHVRSYIQNMFGLMSEKQREEFWNRHFSAHYSVTRPSFLIDYAQINPEAIGEMYNDVLFTRGLLLNSNDAFNRIIATSSDSILQNKYRKLVAIKADLNSSQIISNEIRHQLEKQKDKLEREIMLESESYRLAQENFTIKWQDVQNVLKNDEVAIEFTINSANKWGQFDDISDSIMYYALVLRRGDIYPQLVPLFERDELNQFYGNNKDIYIYDKHQDAAYNLIWSKIKPYLEKCKTIYFSPTHALSQIALEALPLTENSVFGDYYNLYRLTSTREILKIHNNDNLPTYATLYGGISYDVSSEDMLLESEQYVEPLNSRNRSLMIEDTINRGQVHYLPGTKREVETIHTTLQASNCKTTMLTGSAANEESFTSLSSKPNNIIHLATHGFFWHEDVAREKDVFMQYDSQNNIDPLSRCGLLFAGANIAYNGNANALPEGVQDGILTAREISMMDFSQCDLVVLSACETGMGEYSTDGTIGLQRAFKQTGVQSIIMTLWSVNDSAAQLMMTEFYNNWIGKHQSKREAFRNAQNTVRTQYEEPEYWAGFIMLD